MNPPAPEAAARRPRGHVDLARAPVIGKSVRLWHSLVLAHTAARREAKAVLFAELAEATRQGAPLHQALALCSQTVKEAARGAERSAAKGADTRYRGISIFSALCMTLLWPFAMFIYFLSSFRLVDVERISRLLSQRLHYYAPKGLSLSEAMKRCAPDYDEQEIRLIEAGEQWGDVPSALKRAAEFQVTESRLTAQGTQMLYPFGLGLVLLTVGSFALMFILPKFRDIYDQLGSDLPPLTAWLIDLSYALFSGALGFLFVMPAVLLTLFYIFRSFMNGNRLTKYLLAAPIVVGALSAVPFLFQALLAAVEGLLNRPGAGGAGAGLVMLTGVIVLFGVLTAVIVFVPRLLTELERTILSLERRFAPLMRRLPLIGAASRAEAEARWMAALALALESGVPGPEAVRSAGRVCGGPLEKRSEAAAGAVAAGRTIGEACVAHSVLQTETNHRLVLLDAYSEYTDGLRSVADDASRRAFETLYRSGRVTAVLGIVLMGVAVGLFAVGMYLPLFNIPRIVGLP